MTQTTTSLSADEMIQFAWAFGIQVALASYGMLKDVWLKANVGQNAGPRPHRSSQSPYQVVAVQQSCKLSYHGQATLCRPSPKQTNMPSVMLVPWKILMIRNS